MISKNPVPVGAFQRMVLITMTVFFMTLLLSFTASAKQVKPATSAKQARPATLEAFTTDNCSASPDQTYLGGVDWKHCCIAHDISYWIGGTSDKRANADEELRQCMHRAGAAEFIGQFYKFGVFMGGSPSLPLLGGRVGSPFRWKWSYGWKNHKVGYIRHSHLHLQQVQAQLQKLIQALSDGTAAKVWNLNEQQRAYIYVKANEVMLDVIAEAQLPNNREDPN